VKIDVEVMYLNAIQELYNGFYIKGSTCSAYVKQRTTSLPWTTHMWGMFNLLKGFPGTRRGLFRAPQCNENGLSQKNAFNGRLVNVDGVHV